MGQASITHTLVVPSSTRHLARVRRFVHKHARMAEMNEQHAGHLQMAVDEACANIIEHAYRGDPNEKVNLTLTINPDSIVVLIRDRGRSFDLDTYRRPNVVELSRKRKSGGLGVDMIRRVMDEVEYFHGDGFNEIRLVKFLHSSL